MLERERLLARIHRRGYETVTAEVRLGPLAFGFTRIKDPNVVLDQVAEEEDRLDRLAGKRRDGDELHLPYWAELWDSAHGVAEWMVENLAAEAPGLSAIDLGCGMGLTGSVAARLGARVVFADLEADALMFARLNAIGAKGAVRTRRLNWRKDQLGERFDLIVGADILYERAQWQYLEPFWRAHLAGGGRVVLGEPGRQTGDLFLEWIGGQGWSLEMVKRQVPTREAPVRVLVLRRV